MAKIRGCVPFKLLQLRRSDDTSRGCRRGRYACIKGKNRHNEE